MLRGSMSNDLPDLFLEFGPREHHAPVARQAADTDVGAGAGHLPLVPSAGVRLAHTYLIADAYLEWFVTQ